MPILDLKRIRNSAPSRSEKSIDTDLSGLPNKESLFEKIAKDRNNYGKTKNKDRKSNPKYNVRSITPQSSIFSEASKKSTSKIDIKKKQASSKVQYNKNVLGNKNPSGIFEKAANQNVPGNIH